MAWNLYDEFTGWLKYNFPGVELTNYQDSILKAILELRVPPNSKELAQRLKDLLPKARK
jgi:hypothetical protein